MTYIIYGRDNCPYCTKSTSMLDSMGIEYEYLDITKSDILNELLERVPEAKTVPQIFRKEPGGELKHIGGYVEMVAYFFKG